MTFRTWLGCRPILGILVPKRYLPIGPREHWFLIRHDRANMFLRDPYGIKENAGDPRSDWGTQKQAWRFPRPDLAQHVIDVYGWPGNITKVSAELQRQQ